ncbi:TetR/AcrR family transcriptional regulator [Burkholderia multivorans]|nr:TetR/AcrR family transcriptional regulator [Burkholderia multivorans]
MRGIRDKPAYGEGRQALINAAIRLVAREGVTGLTYRSLAAEAGVTTGTLQHHFKSTDDLLDSALEYCLNQSLQYVTEMAKSIDEFVAVLERFIEVDREILVFQVELSIASRRRPELAGMVERSQKAYRQITYQLLHQMDVPADEAFVELLMAIVDGIGYEAVVFGRSQHARTKLQFDMLKRVIENQGRKSA